MLKPCHGLKGARNKIAHSYNSLPQNKEVTSQNATKNEIKNCSFASFNNNS
jgi:hypothetical protein